MCRSTVDYTSVTDLLLAVTNVCRSVSSSEKNGVKRDC